GDVAEREVELLAALALLRVEDLAGQALGVHAHVQAVLALRLALDQRDVLQETAARGLLAEDHHAQQTVLRRDVGLRVALHRWLAAGFVVAQAHPRVTSARAETLAPAGLLRRANLERGVSQSRPA